MRSPVLFTVFACLMSVVMTARGAAQSVHATYRASADAFEILDQVSEWWPGFTDPAYRAFWRDSVGFVAGDSLRFARYAQLREKYYDKSGQGNNRSRRDGSGLFSDRTTLTADPIAAAFYAADSVGAAIRSLRTLLTDDEREFLSEFHAHFAARLTPMLAQTRVRTAASRAVTERTLGQPEVAQHIDRARVWLGADTSSFTALYVWWPFTDRTSANPSGRHLILRIRPTADDTVNSADVVTHEIMHVFAATMDDTRKRAISIALLDGCAVPDGIRRLAVVEEPIATVFGNIEFRRRFMPNRFQWGRRWYGDDWVDLYAKLLYPVITGSMPAQSVAASSFTRDAIALCVTLARARSTRD